MTKIHVTAEALRHCLTGMGKVISNKSTLPILSYLKLETAKNCGSIIVSATNLDEYAQHVIEPCEIEGDAFTPVCVDYYQLKKLVNGKNGKENGFEFLQSIKVTPPVEGEEGSKEKRTLILKLAYTLGGQRLEVGLNTLPADEAPPVPETKGVALELDSYEVRSMLRALKFSSVDESRYVLNGVALDGRSGDDNNAIVATDGRRLQMFTNTFLLPGLCVIVPKHAKALWWLASLIEDDQTWSMWYQKQEHDLTDVEKDAHHQAEKDAEKEGVEYVPPFAVGGGWMTVSVGQWKIVTKQIEGNYPNWKQVVPNDSNIVVTLTDAALDFVSNSLPALPDNSRGGKDPTVMIVVEGDDVFLRTEVVSDTGDSEVIGFKVNGAEVKYQHDRKDTTVSFNRHFFIDAMGERFREWHITDELSPLKLIDEHRRHVLMPMRMS